jgi:hypothetical protein
MNGLIMKKLIVLSVVVVSVIGLATATPAITEVTTSFGNTYEYDGDPGSISFAFSDHKIVAKEDTKITLCVTEVEAENKESVEYEFIGGNPTEAKCGTWEYDKSDYSASGWSLAIAASNPNEPGNSISQVQVNYNNIVLPEESSKQAYNYETVKLSRTKYQELKEKEESAITPSKWESKQCTGEGCPNILIENEEWKEVQDTLKERKERVKRLGDKINELKSQINESETENNKESRQSKEKKQGFVGRLIGSIVG